MNYAQIIANTGPIGLVVLAILLAFSIISWTIIFLKWVALNRAYRSSEKFSDLFWQNPNFDEVARKTKHYQNSPLVSLFNSGLQESMRSPHTSGHENHKERVIHALRRASSEELASLERYNNFLATVGSTAPFIGLFGTVIGIMNSFHQIGAQNSASLATVAPGIAEALIATAAGLMAAIPAVIAYNYFGGMLRKLSVQMDTFAGDFLMRIDNKNH